MEASEVNLHGESPIPNLKRRNSGSFGKSCLEESIGLGALCSRRGWPSRGSEEPVTEPADSHGTEPLTSRNLAPPSRRNLRPLLPGSAAQNLNAFEIS